MTEEAIFQKMAALCAKGEKCSQQIREKLLHWKIDEDSVERIVNRLVAERFIDNARYAKAFAHDKAHFAAWGSIKISHALRMKGIDNNDIEDAIALIDPDFFEQTLVTILRNKKREIVSKPENKQRQTLYRYAVMHGFPTSKITYHINKLFKEDESDNLIEE